MRNALYMAIVFVTLIALSCADDQTQARADWELITPLTYRDTFVFDFDIQDTAQSYFLGMDVHFDYVEYPFQNIYFQVDTRYPDGETQKELLNLDFSDKKGVIKGECLGTTCELPLYLQRRIHFDQKGAYSIKLVQHTRRDSLPGIQSMSLVLGAEPFHRVNGASPDRPQ